MTYTEFIKEIENNIAKANCNKLNIGEYEEKQKQIYKQIRADAFDDFVNACKENIMCQTFGLHQKAVENIVEQLKEQDNEQIHI